MSSPAQASLSHYFTQSPSKPSKRPSSPIDLTLDDHSDSPPPPKKAKHAKVHTARESSAPDGYASTGRKPVAKKRKQQGNFRETLKRDNSMFLDTLEDSQPGPSRRSEPASDDHTLPPRTQLDDGFEAFQTLVESGTRLRGSKGKRQKSSPGDSASPTKAAKGKQRIGPSGETYTPLESQVCADEIFAWSGPVT